MTQIIFISPGKFTTQTFIIAAFASYLDADYIVQQASNRWSPAAWYISKETITDHQENTYAAVDQPKFYEGASTPLGPVGYYWKLYGRQILNRVLKINDSATADSLLLRVYKVGESLSSQLSESLTAFLGNRRLLCG